MFFTGKEYSNIHIKGGRILERSGFSEKGKLWTFENEDPQMVFEADEKTEYMQMNFDREEPGADGTLFSQIYYAYDEMVFSEEKSVIIDFSQYDRNEVFIHFPEPVKYVRFDPSFQPGSINVENLTVFLGESKKEVQNKVSGKRFKHKEKEKIIVYSHDMTMTGAPILAWSIASELKKNDVDVIVLAGGGQSAELAKRYRDNGICFCCMNFTHWGSLKYFEIAEDQENYVENFIRALAWAGHNKIILNSVVSGKYAGIFRKNGFKIEALVHEMQASMELYQLTDMANEVAEYADTVVFPNEIVRDNFINVTGKVNGKIMIRPQGVYAKKVTASDHRCITEKLGISDDDLLVLGMGSIELRKGTDLFVSTAQMTGKTLGERKVHYVWIGELLNRELYEWIRNQIIRSGYQEHIHFVPTINDRGVVRAVQERADVFLALSREDPFPSVVLESMNCMTPVVGFDKTGGIGIMLKDGRGKLADPFDLTQVVEMTKELLLDPPEKEMLKKAKKYTDELDFPEYVMYVRNNL